MSTVILTPLFPPDPSTSAQYVKLLASKLEAKPLTVIAYGSLPESVPNVTIVPISKRSNKLLRVWRCLLTLVRLAPTTLIVQNGPSAELPALLFSYLKKVRLVYIISDHDAATEIGRLAKRLQSRANHTIKLPTGSTTYLPAEWLPFNEDVPDTIKVDTWWQHHTANILHDNNQ